jgi:hypothetical protein
MTLGHPGLNDPMLSRSETTDWGSVMNLLDQGASPDYESPAGITCLLLASLEDPEAVNHRLIRDDNDRYVERSPAPRCFF